MAAPEEPKMGDLGILASLDPVALDRACVDRVRASEDHGKVHLIELRYTVRSLQWIVTRVLY